MRMHVVLAAFRFLSSVAVGQLPEWQVYRDRFVSKEGRVIDDVNNAVSHSESQGYGLLLAEANGDLDAFERILEWTTKHLAVRKDPLFAWRWRPGVGVDDPNNATDGDLLIAWALKRGAERWDVPQWTDKARLITRHVRQHLIRPSKYGPLLLPGEQGFEREEGIIVNLSYWLFPAWKELAEIDPAEEWAALEESGRVLCDQGRFGDWKLPPDWLLVGKDKLSLPGDFPPVFGYNAIRVPLHLWWAGRSDHPCVEACRRYRDLASQTGTLAATLDLKTGSPSPEPALAGMRDVLTALGGGDAAPSAGREGYYSSSLRMLAALAQHELSTSRTP